MNYGCFILMLRFAIVVLCLPFCCGETSARVSVESQVIVSTASNVISDYAVKGELYLRRPGEVPVFLPGDKLYAGCLVRGFARDLSGKYELTADFRLDGPEGTTIHSERKYAYACGYSADNYRYVLLEPMLEYEVDDAPGRYVVRCVVNDEVAAEQSVCERYYEVVTSRQVKELLLKSVDTIVDIDDLWAMYFETADPALVRRILQLLQWAASGTPEQLALAQAAEWSLTVNAARDTRVLGICRDFVAVSDFSIREALLRLIRMSEGRG
jgi:hypothetical protein